MVSLEHDPVKCEAWRENVAEAGLEEWAELVEGDAFETLRETQDVFDLVFLDAEKDDYEALFALVAAAARARARSWSRTTSSRTPIRSPRTRRPGRPIRRSSSVTVPLDRGLELTVALTGRLHVTRPPSIRRSAYALDTAERRWSGLSDDCTGSGGTSG